MSNTHDTQQISPMHITVPFLEPADMESTIEVETPPIHSDALRLPGNSHITAPSLPDLPRCAPHPPGPPEVTPEPYSTTRLPLSYPLLWQAHQDDCAAMRGVLIGLFTIAALILAASIGLTVFIATGVLLAIVLVLMCITRGSV